MTILTFRPIVCTLYSGLQAVSLTAMETRTTQEDNIHPEACVHLPGVEFTLTADHKPVPVLHDNSVSPQRGRTTKRKISSVERLCLIPLLSIQYKPTLEIHLKVDLNF